MRPIIGIDPGVTGSIAVISDHWKKVIKTPRETQVLLTHFNAFMEKLKKKDPQKPFAYIEKLHAFQPEGQSRGNTVGELLRSAGKLDMLLAGFMIETVEIPPVTWQSYMKVLDLTPYYTREQQIDDEFKPTRTLKKQIHYEMSQRIFKGHDFNKEMCDSILIAEFGRRVQAGTIELKNKHLKFKPQ